MAEDGLGEDRSEGGSAWGVTCLVAVAVVVGLVVCGGLGTLLLGGFFAVRVSQSSSSRSEPVRMVLNEYPLPHAQSQPHGIAVGPDGNVWFTEAGGQRIGHISPQGTIAEFPLPKGSGKPLDITAGPDGNLWFTEDGPHIGRMAPTGTVTRFALSAPRVSVGGIAAGRDGNLWFTESGDVDAIGRITPAGAITEFALPHAQSQALAIAQGPDGRLWFTEIGGNRIGRITPQGAITEYPIPTAQSQPSSITAGPNGAVWFTESRQGKIARITTDGRITEGVGVNAGLNGIASDRTGALWVTGGSGEITSIRPDGSSIMSIAVPTPNSQPYGIVQGSDGAIWFTESGGNAIGRVQVSGA
jgi:streptogramin lyase